MESKFEIKCRLLLEEGDIMFKQEFSYDDLKGLSGKLLRFDFAVFDSIEGYENNKPKFLIELQGRQHYEKQFQTAEQFARQQSNDKRKLHYCQAKNIPLVVVPYTDYECMTLDYILTKGKFFD